MRLKLLELKCEKCGYTWTPRINDVRRCPNQKCQSVYFDVPEKIKKLVKE